MNMDFREQGWPDPLAGFEDREPLPDQKSPDGKSLLNPPSPWAFRSSAYTTFPSPIQNASPSAPATNRPASFDLHIYFTTHELPYARRLHTRIRHEFPELRIYPLKENPVGPHPVGMFEVNVFSPEELGAMVGWLTIWRGGLSVLVHPNTEMREGGGAEGDHTTRAMWMGQPYPLQTWMLRKVDEMQRAELEAQTEQEKGMGEDASSVL